MSFDREDKNYLVWWDSENSKLIGSKKEERMYAGKTNKKEDIQKEGQAKRRPQARTSNEYAQPPQRP